MKSVLVVSLFIVLFYLFDQQPTLSGYAYKDKKILLNKALNEFFKENNPIIVRYINGSELKLYDMNEELLIPNNSIYENPDPDLKSRFLNSTGQHFINDIWIEAINYSNSGIPLGIEFEITKENFNIYIIICHQFCKTCNVSSTFPDENNTQCEECNGNYRFANEIIPTAPFDQCILIPTIQKEIEQAQIFDKADINVYDPEDPFFNDICVKSPLDDGIDLPRKDRVNQYLQKSMCEDGCDLKKMNFDTSEPICVCPGASAKNGDLTFEGIKTNLLATLIDANFEVVFCHMLVFNADMFPVNIGSWVMLALGLGIIATFVVFLCNNIKPLMDYLKTLKAEPKPNAQEIAKNNIEDSHRKHITEDNVSSKVMIYQSRPVIKVSEIEEGSAQIPVQLQEQEENKVQIENQLQIKDQQQSEVKDIDIEKHEEDNNNQKNSLNVINEVEEQKILTTDDYDEMEYDELFISDNRSYCRTYWNYLKSIHPIIDSFIMKSDSELKIIKISNFLMSILLDLSLTAFFYSDKYISNNNQNESNDFIYNLPVSIYTFLAGGVINTGIAFIASSDSSIKKIEKIEDQEKMDQQIDKFHKCYKIRCAVYYFFQIAFTLFFWYYVSAFCGVYENSQEDWIIGCATSFAISMIMPFVFCIAFAAIRKLGLRLKSKCILKLLSLVTKFV